MWVSHKRHRTNSGNSRDASAYLEGYVSSVVDSSHGLKVGIESEHACM